MTTGVTFPKKLQPGDEIRVIAPSRSLSLISVGVRRIALKRLADKGYKVTFGKNAEEHDDFVSSSIKSRVDDLHDAFADKNVKAILTAIGGYNSIQLLGQIDYELIRENPKILMGFSDITTLCNAILAKTGLVTYYGPHFSTWGMLKGFNYTAESFTASVEKTEEYKLLPSLEWSDDLWFMDQKARVNEKDTGGKIWHTGAAEGRVIGGNLSTLGLLQGTAYWPSMDGSILCLEDDSETSPQHFDRCLQSLMYQPDFEGVRAILIGRFQKDSGMTEDLLGQIIVSKPELARLPILSNLSFGHTTPITVLPIGGGAKVVVKNEKYDITIVKH